MKAVIRPATFNDAKELLDNLSDADKGELQILAIKHPFAELIRLIVRFDTYTVVANNSVVAMFGCVDHSNYGQPWMLSTAEVSNVKMTSRTAKQICKGWLLKHNYLTNVAWSKNTAHLAWIDFLGFEFSGIEEYNDHKFVRFEMRNESIPASIQANAINTAK